MPGATGVRAKPGGALKVLTASASVLLILGAGCWSPRLQMARTPPVSPVVYSRADVERIARASVLREYPAIRDLKVTVGGPWTEFPGVTRGRPVYSCEVLGYLVERGHRMAHTPVFLVDATTGRIFQPALPAPG
jgi:hypothetical protein